jgi:hypothetical protein
MASFVIMVGIHMNVFRNSPPAEPPTVPVVAHGARTKDDKAGAASSGSDFPTEERGIPCTDTRRVTQWEPFQSPRHTLVSVAIETYE